MALSPAEKQRQYRDRKKGLEAARELGRRYGEEGIEKARSLGRAYGTDEVRRLALSAHPSPDPKGRVERAIRYAEWNWTENGKIA